MNGVAILFEMGIMNKIILESITILKNYVNNFIKLQFNHVKTFLKGILIVVAL